MFNSQFASKWRLAGNIICIKYKNVATKSCQIKNELFEENQENCLEHNIATGIFGAVTSCGTSCVIRRDVLCIRGISLMASRAHIPLIQTPEILTLSASRLGLTFSPVGLSVWVNVVGVWSLVRVPLSAPLPLPRDQSQHCAPLSLRAPVSVAAKATMMWGRARVRVVMKAVDSLRALSRLLPVAHLPVEVGIVP